MRASEPPGRHPEPLAELLAHELSRPAPRAAGILAEAIRERHGDAVAAVVFYGSCLRDATHEGVLDFYVLVDAYARAYASRTLAALNALLPPNVFYLEVDSPLGRLRSKYAVISCRDFAYAVSPRCIHPYVWARFAQPALLVHARDPAARDAVLGAVRQSALTLVSRLVPLLPAGEAGERFSPAELWHTAFRETYAAELRAETPGSTEKLYRAAPERYDAVALDALRELERGGRLRLELDERRIAVSLDPRERRTGRRAWRIRRQLAKFFAVARLLKTAGTFGDWLPYALWKIERHSGVRVEVSERQRRRPLIWGWPVLFKLIRQRVLR